MSWISCFGPTPASPCRTRAGHEQADGIEVPENAQAVVRMALQLQREVSARVEPAASAAQPQQQPQSAQSFTSPKLHRSLTSEFLEISNNNSSSSSNSSNSASSTAARGAGVAPDLPALASDCGGDAESSGGRAGAGGGEGYRRKWSATYLTGTLSSKGVRLLQATTRIIEWMSKNEEHLRPLVELVVSSVYVIRRARARDKCSVVLCRAVLCRVERCRAHSHPLLSCASFKWWWVVAVGEGCATAWRAERAERDASCTFRCFNNNSNDSSSSSGSSSRSSSSSSDNNNIHQPTKRKNNDDRL